MSKKIFVTQQIPDIGIAMLRNKGYEVTVSAKQGILSHEELLSALTEAPYDAVLTLLTNKTDSSVFDAVPTAKIFANYAVGYNNVDVAEAGKRGIVVTNTPGALTESVADHAVGLILALGLRIVEADAYLRAGKYKGWEPMGFLGSDFKGQTLGILGAGRIGYRTAEIMKKGFDMNIVYYDVKQNPIIEKELGAVYCATPEEVLKVSDIVSVHTPLIDSTHHLINADRLKMMKKTAFLINTSRGPVVDESALVEALRAGTIAGAGLDVFENEPALAEGLADLPNVVLTPHIASATPKTRDEMAVLAAQNIIDFFDGKVPQNVVK
jgi:glyoxylate reductase